MYVLHRMWRQWIPFAALPGVAYLWCAAGSMNNILKDMPVLGMSQGAPVFLYPGHGSFCGEKHRRGDSV